MASKRSRRHHIYSFTPSTGSGITRTFRKAPQYYIGLPGLKQIRHRGDVFAKGKCSIMFCLDARQNINCIRYGFDGRLGFGGDVVNGVQISQHSTRLLL